MDSIDPSPEARGIPLDSDVNHQDACLIAKEGKCVSCEHFMIPVDFIRMLYLSVFNATQFNGSEY